MVSISLSNQYRPPVKPQIKSEFNRSQISNLISKKEGWFLMETVLGREGGTRNKWIDPDEDSFGPKMGNFKVWVDLRISTFWENS